MSNYLPKSIRFNYEKTLTLTGLADKYAGDLAAAEGISEDEARARLTHKAKIRTRSTGEDENYFVDLRDMRKRVGNEMLPAYSTPELMVLTCLRFIIEWDFKDEDTGEPLPITAENLKSLDMADYDVIMQEFGKVMGIKSSGANTPKPNPPEEEKN